MIGLHTSLNDCIPCQRNQIMGLKWNSKLINQSQMSFGMRYQQYSSNKSSVIWGIPKTMYIMVVGPVLGVNERIRSPSTVLWMQKQSSLIAIVYLTKLIKLWINVGPGVDKYWAVSYLWARLDTCSATSTKCRKILPKHFFTNASLISSKNSIP